MINTSPTEGGGNAPATPEKIWATLQRTSDLMAESRADIAKGRAEMAEIRASQKEHFEIDIVAANGAEVVVVEVKTTLGSEDVTEFLDKLSQFVEWSPEYRERRIYGAVAYLKSDASVTKYADRRGLFVIRATGNSASIVNEPDFEPRAFG